jgi:decaprenylphospho-beta-D-ribofuranose 2-oxidase
MTVNDGSRQRLTGWGGTAPSYAHVVDVVDRDGAGEAVKAALARTSRGVVARGLGRSYGDAAQNGGGTVLRMSADTSAARLDAAAATVTVPAGVSLDALMRWLVPQGWFVPVTPGTRLVTVGGAVASDIHGKNHHVDGSFGNHVRSLTVLLADGSVVDVSPTDDPDLFWATIGGMGLTGLILEVTVGVLPIETSRIVVETRRLPDLDALIATMTEGDHLHRYSVSWIDLVSTGKRLGRSVLTWGEHATLDQLAAADRQAPLTFAPRQLGVVPPVIPGPGLLNHTTVAAFNELWFRKAPRHRVGEIQSIAAYFHPLDAVASWNRLYGRRGFVQYQFVVPFGAEGALREVVEALSSSGAASFLAVLKRFGAGNAAPLSFPSPGWTLAVDIPASARGLSELFSRLDRMVLDAGGRHYLAKDAFTTPQAIREGYPRLDEWLAVRHRVDPDGAWQSDLARRLGL